MVDLPTMSPAASTSSLPPPSIADTVSSFSSYHSNSLSLEVAILRSQLDSASESLRQSTEQLELERSRFQRQLQAAQDQFAKERAAYLEYIASLESGRR